MRKTWSKINWPPAIVQLYVRQKSTVVRRQFSSDYGRTLLIQSSRVLMVYYRMRGFALNLVSALMEWMFVFINHFTSRRLPKRAVVTERVRSMEKSYVDNHHLKEKTWVKPKWISFYFKNYIPNVGSHYKYNIFQLDPNIFIVQITQPNPRKSYV